jgi:hypothetical protein
MNSKQRVSFSILRTLLAGQNSRHRQFNTVVNLVHFACCRGEVLEESSRHELDPVAWPKERKDGRLVAGSGSWLAVNARWCGQTCVCVLALKGRKHVTV